jgi:predicted DNA-binding protein with PD1-like motif
MHYDDLPAQRAHSAPSRLLTAAVIALAVLVVISIALGGAALHQSQQQQQHDQGRQKSSTIAFRLKPGAELVSSIMSVVQQHKLRSSFVVTVVGSLTQYAIRFANSSSVNVTDGAAANPPTTYEIVSLVGTAGYDPATNTTSHHLHISLGDGRGASASGHLSSPSIVYTTAEIVLGFDCTVVFRRAVDGSTPWDELQVDQMTWC